jgi:hypothetical protein
MREAIISLLSSIVGGGLVLAGQILAHQSEDRRHWRTLLQAAAAEVATSFAQERAQLTVDRRRGRTTSDIDEITYTVDRQRALGRLRTPPGGDSFDPEIDAMGSAVEELWRALSSAEDEEWLASRRGLKEAIMKFNERVRTEIQRP